MTPAETRADALRDILRAALSRMEQAHEKLKADPRNLAAQDDFEAATRSARLAFDELEQARGRRK